MYFGDDCHMLCGFLHRSTPNIFQFIAIIIKHDNYRTYPQFSPYSLRHFPHLGLTEAKLFPICRNSSRVAPPLYPIYLCCDSWNMCLYPMCFTSIIKYCLYSFWLWFLKFWLFYHLTWCVSYLSCHFICSAYTIFKSLFSVGMKHLGSETWVARLHNMNLHSTISVHGRYISHCCLHIHHCTCQHHHLNKSRLITQMQPEVMSGSTLRSALGEDWFLTWQRKIV